MSGAQTSSLHFMILTPLERGRRRAPSPLGVPRVAGECQQDELPGPGGPGGHAGAGHPALVLGGRRRWHGAVPQGPRGVGRAGEGAVQPLEERPARGAPEPERAAVTAPGVVGQEHVAQLGQLREQAPGQGAEVVSAQVEEVQLV